MKRGILTGFTTGLLTTTAASACPTCRPDVVAAIFDEHFWGRLLLTFHPFLILLLIVSALYFATREVPAPAPVKQRARRQGRERSR
ncbi:hypothetical protein HV824_27905 [Myxococcus sp. AM009]|uniref:hypothetical protein n=1 Tax=unclassified Myxococcus TaxID=2648731 RepID=UPI001595DE23|nr:MULTISPECIES: hypothetical protein [unclassified Myxococcus]NVJ01925.1 hypothetical protein [Myxococcus sp. AM009]NVJ14526.1 hypothetical protein [Myxococcus sp. AM010]